MVSRTFNRSAFFPIHMIHVSPSQRQLVTVRLQANNILMLQKLRKHFNWIADIHNLMFYPQDLGPMGLWWTISTHAGMLLSYYRICAYFAMMISCFPDIAIGADSIVLQAKYF